MHTYISKSIKETEDLAEKLLNDIRDHAGLLKVHNAIQDDGDVIIADNKEALIIALNGHLGSGKTTFVQSVAKHLGIKENITSPTFVIMKKYNIRKADFPFKTLVHIDAYRLEGGKELGALDIEKLVTDGDNLILKE